MTISSELVTLEVSGRSTAAYLVAPEGAGPWPGVVVIQEWWGLEEHIKDVARRFAGEGFVAIAPDLYYGEIATEPDEAQKLRMALDWDQALAAIQVAIDELLGRDEVWPRRVGVIGFCMGGGLTWHAAAKLSQVAVAAPFYGGGPELTDQEVAQISGPVLAIFGELDQGVSPEVAKQRDSQLDRAGVKHETIIYPQAQHAFFNDTRAAYNPEAAADAWQRVIRLFGRVLRDEPSLGEALNEVGQQFQALGQSLATALKAVWQSEEMRQNMSEVQTHVEAMAGEFSKAAKQTMASEEAQHVQSEVEKAAQSAKSSGRQVAEEVRPQLLAAFRQVRSELDGIIGRMEQRPAPAEKSADEATSEDPDITGHA
ncbi:MAG: IncQ-type mobilization protein MobB [Anaerolineae bacterium]|nr:IncQ-type mobilization protein MobB [Anaerolineae bacterium]